jgi:uncharacterized protein YraI
MEPEPQRLSPAMRWLCIGSLPVILALVLACGSGNARNSTAARAVTPAAKATVEATVQGVSTEVTEIPTEEVAQAATARAVRTANLRAGPSTSYTIVRQVSKDTVVHLQSYRDEGEERWYEVQIGDAKGWMSNIVLDVNDEVTKTIPKNTEALSPPPKPQLAPAEPAVLVAEDCDPSYPGVCIPPKSQVGDLDCGEIAYRRFRVTGSDPHGFDRDNDGIGCES